MASTFVVVYRLRYHGNEFKYRVELDVNGLVAYKKTSTTPPDWTKLSFHQCPNCPYTVEQLPHCPVAVNLAKFVDDWRDVASFDELELTVETPLRTVVNRTSMQSALRSILGLVVAGSDCSYTKFFRIMARQHMPLANSEETVTRAVSIYLLQQFLQNEKDGRAVVDLAGLRAIYDNIGIVNVSLSKRLKSLDMNDSLINALVGLDVFGKTLVFSLDDSLNYLKSIFPVSES